MPSDFLQDELMELVNPNCLYYDVDEFNSAFIDTRESLVILHQNIRSFNANSDEFLLFVSQIERKVDVIVLTETWFCKN